MKKRAGEPVSLVTISTIALIVGFITLVFFLYKNSDSFFQTEYDICKLSVIARATSPSAAERLFPLKCTTKKICLSLNGEECSQFIGEKNVKTINLPSNEETAARKIEETSANAVYDCWKMLGEGKLDLFGGKKGKDLVTDFAAKEFSAGNIKPKCVICSRIAISQELKEKDNILKEVNLNRYLEKEQVPGSSLTYLQTLTDRQVNAYPSEFKESFSTSASQQTDEIAFIFMQVIADSRAPLEIALEKGPNTGIAIAGGVMLNPLGKVTSLVTAKLTAIATILGSALSGGISYIQAGNNQEIAAVHCGKFTSVEDQYGCSVISPVNYDDTEKINQLCFGGIEGYP